MIYKRKNTTKNQNLITNLTVGLVVFILLLVASQSVKAQFSASIYNTIQVSNQNLWNDMNRYNETFKQGEKIASGSSSTTSNTTTTIQPPPLRQFPITATDFTPSPNRIVPDQLVNAMTNLTTEQKETVRNAYNQTLTLFETKARKNNLANSIALVVQASLKIVTGKPLSGSDIVILINYYNNALANTPQFKSFSAKQKQILYESLILTAFAMDALYTQGVTQNNLALQKQAKDLAKSMLKSLVG